MKLSIYRCKEDNIKQINVVKSLSFWLGSRRIALIGSVVWLLLRMDVSHEGTRKRIFWTQRENLGEDTGEKKG